METSSPTEQNVHSKFRVFLKLTLFSFRLMFAIFENVITFFVELVISKKPKSIAGQLALVTGGANGLGREIARFLAKEKCNVVICDLDIENANITAKEIECEFGVSAKAYKVNVSHYEEVEQLKRNIETDIGCVDILVNNAGIMPLMSLKEGKFTDYEKTIAVNVLSNLWTCRVFMDGMIERKRGHIVAIASLSALTTIPRAILYSASKFAVRGFMEALYDELHIDNHDKYINLTTVYPTFISTRKDLLEAIDKIGNLIKISPAHAAEEVLNGILYNKMSVLIPEYYRLVAIYSGFIPTQIFKTVKKSFIQNENQKLMDDEEI